MVTIWAWVAFLTLVLAILAIDLGVLNRTAHVVRMREAITFTVFTMVLAAAFAGLIFVAYEHHMLALGIRPDAVDHAVNGGRLAAIKFLTGYLVELSLSMDNVFVIALLFHHLRVPAEHQHRVLFWGILGALVMRGAMIGIGTSLVARFQWVLYLFGAFLVFTAVRILVTKDEHEAPEEAAVVRFLRRHFRVSDRFADQHFIVRINAQRYLTPLAVALVLVETSDLIFAVDSIPAIFAITEDPFLVFTSNVFAILCLRSLYFGLASLIEKFRYLKVSLAIILALVGLKMLAAAPLHRIAGETLNLWILGLVIAILVAGALASAIVARWERDRNGPPGPA